MDTETYSTDGPECPYCGHKHRADEPVYYDERTTEMDCDRCEKTFAMSLYISHSWTCNQIE